MAVRKLLVASQKGGVGKTTTSMNLAAAAAAGGTRILLLDADPLSNISSALNLAEHPHRQSLRQAGIELPGVLVTNLVAGLDILSPYEEGRCSDDDLDRLLRALDTPAARGCYGCLIVDVPPFLGANPAQLISSCDEYLLVMRAEAMAYRTLPAFLELVQRSSRDGHAIQLHGILLTLPEGEQPGCRWERELRGRFGARALPETIPHDETIGKALRTGQISSHLHPDSPAARAYRQLAAKLGLAAESRPAAAAEQVTQALREAATTVQFAAVAVGAAPSADPSYESATDFEEAVDLFGPAPESLKSAGPSSPRSRHSGRSGEPQRPVRAESATSNPSPVSPSTRLQPGADSLPLAEPVPAVAAASSAPSAAAALSQLWPLWILLGAVLGGGLRLVPLPPSVLPILVGFSVAVIAVVVLRTLAAAQSGTENSTASNKRKGRARLRAAKTAASRSEAKPDPAARLASLAAKSARREPRAN
ncbi:MAG TPA: ParA family protein [Gemmataceae bacterium]|jgi:chromosome partitioning protein